MFADESSGGYGEKALFADQVAQFDERIFVIAVPIEHGYQRRGLAGYGCADAAKTLDSSLGYTSSVDGGCKEGHAVNLFLRRGRLGECQVGEEEGIFSMGKSFGHLLGDGEAGVCRREGNQMEVHG